MQRLGLLVLLLSLALVAGTGWPGLGDERGWQPSSRDDVERDDGEIGLFDEEMDRAADMGSGAGDVGVAADYWGYPLSPWRVSQHAKVWRSGYGFHLGDDVIKPAYTKVYNARWGYVRHVGRHSGYGYVVIVESPVRYEPSTNPALWRDNNVVCQVYGHLRWDSYLAATKARIGKTINRGWIIGRLGTPAENGGWTPHLHYGIRRYRYTPTYWLYWGYTPYAAVRDQWYHPCSIIRNY